MMLHENIHHALQQLSLQFLPAFKLKTFHIRDRYLLLINSYFVIYYYSSDPGPACSVTAMLTKLNTSCAGILKIQPDPVDHAPFFPLWSNHLQKSAGYRNRAGEGKGKLGN
jgi:hypothetical protein